MVEFAYSEKAKFPNALEQVENLIVWLAENVPFPGQRTDLDAPRFQAVIGCVDDASFVWVVHSAAAAGWLDGKPSSTKDSYVHRGTTLTLAGWNWYQQHGRHRRSKLAFMAMQYNEPTIEKMVSEFFRPAVQHAGFDLRLLKDRPEAGIIDNRLRVEIRRSRFLVCDLTHGNQGAYWEAGFAEGIGIPVIYTCEESVLRGKKVHFDTRNSLIIPWEAGKADAADLLKATIRNTLPEEALLDDPNP